MAEGSLRTRRSSSASCRLMEARCGWSYANANYRVLLLSRRYGTPETRHRSQTATQRSWRT
eukprot:1515403-Prorocentrum_lima.AAC.1